MVSCRFSEEFRAECLIRRGFTIYTIGGVSSLPLQVMYYYASIAEMADPVVDFFDLAVASVDSNQMGPQLHWMAPVGRHRASYGYEPLSRFVASGTKTLISPKTFPIQKGLFYWNGRVYSPCPGESINASPCFRGLLPASGYSGAEMVFAKVRR